MRIILLLIIFFNVINSNSKTPNFYEKYFDNCDIVLDNGNFKTCYSFKYKSATSSIINLNASDIDTNNISKRPNFYEDKNIPHFFRTNTNDYTNTGFDRGHIQSDASNDYNQHALNLTYVMSNIALQYPNTNRQSYFAVEKRERELTKINGVITVLTLIKYTDNKVNGINIPSNFIKIFFNNNFLECYNIKNDNKKYTLDEMRVKCDF